MAAGAKAGGATKEGAIAGMAIGAAMGMAVVIGAAMGMAVVAGIAVVTGAATRGAPAKAVVVVPHILIADRRLEATWW